MDTESIQLKKKHMKYSFYSFVIFTLVGIVLAITKTFPLLGYGLLMTGIILGVICACSPCPYCSKMSGVLLKPMFSCAFPMGFFFHCGKAYLGKNDQNAS